MPYALKEIPTLHYRALSISSYIQYEIHIAIQFARTYTSCTINTLNFPLEGGSDTPSLIIFVLFSIDPGFYMLLNAWHQAMNIQTDRNVG